MTLGTAGYPNDRTRLGLAVDAPVYFWHLGDSVDDPGLLRNAVDWDGNWRVKPGVRELAQQQPGQTYYTDNEPTYRPNAPTARQLAEVHLDLTQTVDSGATFATPGFAQTELGISWWGGEQYDSGPDGRTYSYAEAWVRWVRALGGQPPAILSWHAYPATGIDARLAVAQVRAVLTAVLRLRELWHGAPCRLILTETGWIDYAAGGPVGNAGWQAAKAYMAELLEAYHRRELGDDVCWFLPRSEACAPGKVGGWPGYLVYSNADPTGRYGSGEQCDPWWWTVRCEIGASQGERDSLTPLGELWRQGAGRPALVPRLWLPAVQKGGDANATTAQ